MNDEHDTIEDAMMKIDKSSFKRLIGVWKTTGEVKSGEDILELVGIDSYELILDGNFILHKADVRIGNERSETLEIIQLQNSPDTAKMQYFNSKGDEGIMAGTIINNEFRIEGDRLMFKGTINDENSVITGKWYTQTDHKTWDEFIELVLRKQ